MGGFGRKRLFHSTIANRSRIPWDQSARHTIEETHCKTHTKAALAAGTRIQSAIISQSSDLGTRIQSAIISKFPYGGRAYGAQQRAGDMPRRVVSHNHLAIGLPRRVVVREDRMDVGGEN